VTGTNERTDGPNTCNTNHCLVEVVIGIDTLCGVQHGLHHGERRWTRKIEVSLVSGSDPSPEKNNKREDTRLVQPYLACALCLRLGDGSAVPVHNRFLGGCITADVSDGTGRREGPQSESRAETMFRS